MGDAAKKRSNFGRDDFRTLIGDGLSERLTRPSYQTYKKKKDVADMTEHETAAMLTDTKPKTTTKVVRHRDTTRQRNYQSLLDEQLQRGANRRRQKDQQQQVSKQETHHESEQEFVQKALVRRAKAAPVVLEIGAKTKHPHEEKEDASSSSSDESDTPLRRQQADDSSSSDSDDSEADRRRARLLERRKNRSQQPAVQPSDQESVQSTVSESSAPPIKSMEPSDDLPTTIRQREKSSSSEDESSNSEEFTSEESTSEEEEVSLVSRPVFVPKHKRGTVKEIQNEELRKEVHVEKDKKYKERRKQESRALVQEAVGGTTEIVEPEGGMETITSAQNAILNDEDDENDLEARYAWEIRELERLLEDWDAEKQRQHEQAEYERRRRMTDEERLKEDEALGRKRPGDRSDSQYQQKFFHRGAFYMDESEWGASDVRRKAAEYAHAATGADKIDKSLLPKVMRVKNFGRANQSRYRGLAAEDTTDKQLEMQPLPKKK